MHSQIYETVFSLKQLKTAMEKLKQITENLGT